MNRRKLALLLSCSLPIAAVACGGISDPTIGSERVATVSGALTGSAVPANARVALVYRKVATVGGDRTSTVEVASDVAIVAGKFSMNLGMPAADYFSPIDGDSVRETTVGSAPPSTGAEQAPDPAPSAGGGSTSGGGGAFGSNVGTRDLVGGGITEPMSAAIAGFVVYADSNGNGKLDLEGPYASTPDQILGGNKELMVVYLKDGGALDYEKMRDKSGILPASGFNLAWSEGRWLPLNVVELKLSASANLPSAVCSGAVGSAGSGSSGNVATPAPVGDSAGPSSGSSSGSSDTLGRYPSPTDPGLQCAPDGRSFTYTSGSGCPPYTPQPQPVGLCAGGGYDYAETAPCAGGGYASSLVSGEPVPEGWPCQVDDAGAADAGADGSADGGAADAGADGG
jgi:hypothetical protein